MEELNNIGKCVNENNFLKAKDLEVGNQFLISKVNINTTQYGKAVSFQVGPHEYLNMPKRFSKLSQEQLDNAIGKTVEFLGFETRNGMNVPLFSFV